ncbi:MAG: enoyl-CoA hydratase/isomerase family protein, partial [Clostridia bacterium]|nr:enoyl-CoA hydratase/isomerase family protein [Clostridia bacterium]
CVSWARCCVYATGARRAFCAGGDVATMGPAAPEAFYGYDRMRRTVHPWLTALWESDKPVIAMVNGVAAGGGCSLALAADVALASDRARFSQAFVRVGAVPDIGGMFFLPRAVGLSRAKELMFTGRLIDAAEAERIGLVTRVVPHERLAEETYGLARRLAEGPARAIGLTKRILHRTVNADLAEVLEYEAYAQSLCFLTEDHREGVQAFLEKRPARFRGR